MPPHKPRKRFGQHFLRDPQVLNQIQQTIAPQAHQHLVEIGPGEGVLTELLLDYCQQLDVIEIDRDLVSLLQQRYRDQTKLTIYSHDVLSFDFSQLSNKPQSLRIIGNLPYNISTPLLFHLLKSLHLIQDMHFMLQKEVVQRITATVGDKHYNRLSVMIQYFCDTAFLFEIPPRAFSPPPKVDSAFVRLVPRNPSVTAKDLNLFSELVKTAFAQRRKTLRNNLKDLVGDDLFTCANINSKLRPQELNVNDFVIIANLLYDSRK